MIGTSNRSTIRSSSRRLLPPRAILTAESDQQMIRRELADRILERQQRIVSSGPTMRAGAHLVELAEDGLKPLVRPFSGLVSVGGDPVESPRQCRRARP